jgi:hypothetical protein
MKPISSGCLASITLARQELREIEMALSAVMRVPRNEVNRE